MKPHKHAELIKLWADGAEIECLEDCNSWIPVTKPIWREDWVYRIKPQPKPADLGIMFSVNNLKYQKTQRIVSCDLHNNYNLKLVFDGETGELKSAEVLK